MTEPILICGGDETPGPRGTACPSHLHNHPLPSGYVDAAEVAARRLRKGWGNPKCPECGLYGWTVGLRETRANPTPAATHAAEIEEGSDA